MVMLFVVVLFMVHGLLGTVAELCVQWFGLGRVWQLLHHEYKFDHCSE
jgi:hypothetical protein